MKVVHPPPPWSKCSVRLTIVLLAFSAAFAREEIIQTIAGGGPDATPATSVELIPSAIMADPNGGFYVAGWDENHYIARIYRVDPNGLLSLVAGSGRRWPSALIDDDGAPATEADLGGVCAMSLDPSGNLFAIDTYSGRIRRVDGATAAFTTLGPDLTLTFGLARSAAGDLYVSSWDHRVRRIDAATGAVTTIAGTGVAGFMGDGGPAAAAQLSTPGAIDFDANGNLYIADTGNRRVRRVDALTGNISTVVGTGVAGFEGDGGPALSANLFLPYAVGLTLDPSGNLYLGDWEETGDGPWGGRIRRVDAGTGIISLYAGAGSATGQGIPAIGGRINAPVGLDVDATGDLLIADGGNPINTSPPGQARKVVASTGLLYTIAGGGSSSGDGGLALDATLGDVSGVETDSAGNIYFSQTWNSVRRVDAATGIITLVAGSPALNGPRGLAASAGGVLYIADRSNHRVRRAVVGGGINNYAGNGTPGFGGDGLLATAALLNLPSDVALDPNGNLYIADTYNHRIRVVAATTKRISTFAGNGTPTFWGDGGPSTEASLRRPFAVALDASGTVFIADTENFRIRRVDAAPLTNIITTVAGNGTSGYSGDGGPATSASLGRIESMTVDPDGNLLLADKASHRVRKVDLATGVISTVAGTGAGGFSGDGGPPTLATLDTPDGLAVSPSGGYLIGDNARIRHVAPTSASTEAGMAGDELTLTAAPLGMITLSWSPSCHSGDTEYTVYEGTIGSFTSHVPRTCGTGNVTSLTFTPAAADSYYLVVPRSFAREGSYGLDSDDVERPASLSACLPREIVTCP